MNSTPIFLSVSMITYNHQSYISEAIEGVLAQKTDFKIELVLGEDFSTDNTRSICEEYASKYSDKIRVLPSERNLGMMPNFIRTVQACKGKYVALCEGDDFWNDPYKLQKQVDFLEKNKMFSFCFHAVHIKDEIPNYQYKYPLPPKNILTFNSILKNHYIPSCSILIRKEVLPKNFPNFFYKSLMGDIPLELMLADKGKVFFFNEKMGTYRKTYNGITQNKRQIKNGRLAYLSVYKNLIIYFFPRHFFPLSIKFIKTSAGFLRDLKNWSVTKYS